MAEIPAQSEPDGGGNAGISWAGAAIDYIFDLFIDPSTPLDFYDLEFAVAGQDGNWYGDEHFYVQVVPEPGTILMLGMGLALVAGYSHRKRSN